MLSQPDQHYWSMLVGEGFPGGSPLWHGHVDPQDVPNTRICVVSPDHRRPNAFMAVTVGTSQLRHCLSGLSMSAPAVPRDASMPDASMPDTSMERYPTASTLMHM